VDDPHVCAHVVPVKGFSTPGEGAVTLVYLVQHAQKRPEPGDPELTDVGQVQAARTGQWLSRLGLRGVYSSPLRRARQTADAIAIACGLTVHIDDRLRERMNWDGIAPFEEFLRDWERCTQDRDFVPVGGDSSRRAGARLYDFFSEDPARGGPVAAVTHGGVTIDLVRTILGDAVPDTLLRDGVPPCAITVLDGGRVVEIGRQVPAEGFEPPTSGV
jgi:broad specificity phosphatase PhoE